MRSFRTSRSSALRGRIDSRHLRALPASHQPGAGNGLQRHAAARTGGDDPPHTPRPGHRRHAHRSGAHHQNRAPQPAGHVRGRRAHQTQSGRLPGQFCARTRARSRRSLAMKGKDFLSIRDFSPSEILYLLILARQVKTHPTTYCDSLKRETLAMIFEKPSLRTRLPFDGGIQQLGGFSIYLSPAEINLGKRESVYDVAKNLERMVQGIMVRTFAHEIVEQMAQYASIPVINGLTDYSHPCQAMADYLTMLEIKGRIAGLKVAYLGDGNNVARSLMFLGAQLGADVWIATPPGYEPDNDAIIWTRKRCEETGASITITHDPEAAACDADVLYTDVWASMGQEAETEARKK